MADTDKSPSSATAGVRWREGEPLTEKKLKALLLRYEINGSWWAGWIGWGWLQNIVAGYFYRKMCRKYDRWKETAKIRAELEEGDDLEEFIASAT